MGAIQWQGSARSPNPADLDTTGLNGLLGNGGVRTTATIQNATDLDRWVDLGLLVAYAVNPIVGETIDIFLNRTLDGTNFGANVTAPNEWVGAFRIANANTSAQRLFAPNGILLPPRGFRVTLRNNSGQAFAASGNILSGYFYREQAS